MDTNVTPENQGDGCSDRGQPRAMCPGSADATWDSEALDSLLSEANALALYIARHGDRIFAGDAELQDTPYNDLLAAIAGVTASRSASDWQSLMTTYARVTAITYEKRGVNGRTILDTGNVRTGARGSSRWAQILGWFASKRRYRPVTIGVILFAMALTVEVAMNPTVGDSNSDTAKLISALAPLLIPALWGGIGACTFLMKRLSDKLFELSYEESRQRGDVVRIVLGAVLGVVAIQLFTEFSGTADDARLPIMMTAFIAGLGVKPVYAAFEALSDGLARRLGPDGPQAPKP